MLPFHLNPLLAVNALKFAFGHAAILADTSVEAAKHVNALKFAIERATPEGKTTMSALLILSLFSWTIIISKARQIAIARKWTKKFLAAYASTRDPMDIKRRGEEFEGAPAYQLYIRGADELDYHLKNNPITVKSVKPVNDDPALGHGNTDYMTRMTTTRVTTASFEAIKVVMEEAAAGEAMSLEKGMIVLSTAVAGGPFIGLLGTVWGVMETFSGIANAGGASITAMAPGVAGALICTVIGLLVAIPAMFSYNFMVTSIATSRRNWTDSAPDTPTRLNIATWTTGRFRRNSRNPTTCWPSASWRR